MKHTITIILLASLSFTACQSTPKVRRLADKRQALAGIVPCDTDSDCEQENPRKLVHYCDAFTKEGKHCHHRVKEEGLMCWQHSLEFKGDPQGYEARQAKYR